MVAAGNHEADCNYTYANYRGRFAAQNLTGAPTRAPNSNSSRWYSFEQGPVHFVALETDAYGFDEVAYALAPQYAWLAAALAAVDRAATPWVVLFGHRPMYCSSVTATSSAPRLAEAARRDRATRRRPQTTGRLRRRGRAPAVARRCRGTSPRAASRTSCATACTQPTGAERGCTASSRSWTSLASTCT